MNDRTKESIASDGDDKLPRQPAFYIRSKEPLTLGLLLSLSAGVLGIVGFILHLNNRIIEIVDIKIQNERNERINSDNRIEQRLDGCCKRGGW